MVEFGIEHLPCDVRDYEVGFPNRYLIKLGGWVVRRKWQALIGSQRLRRRSSTRTGRERVIRLNGIGGVRLQNPDRNFDPGFFTTHLCHSERGEEISDGFCRNAGMITRRCLKAWPHASHVVAGLRST
jgi:hypothetical protein